jgi:hypothetical protein
MIPPELITAIAIKVRMKNLEFISTGKKYNRMVITSATVIR